MTGLPSSQPAATLIRPGLIEVVDRAVPTPADDEVLVAVSCVGVCGSDTHYYREGRIGSFVVREPLVLGHEAAGTVVACGKQATGPAPGQRVAIEPGFPCRRCHPCRTGRYNLCPDIRFLATPPVDGALTRYLAVPSDFAHPVPDTLSDQAAALIEPLSVAVWACRQGKVGLGEEVLVTGAGPIGVLCALVARAAGARPTVAEVHPDRRARARGLGLEDVVEPSRLAPADRRFHKLIECSGAPAALRQGLGLLGPGGRAVLVGMSGAEDISLPLSLAQTQELTLQGCFRYANTYPSAIGLAAAGHVPLDSMVDKSFGLEQADEALMATTRDPSLLKVVVQP